MLSNYGMRANGASQSRGGRRPVDVTPELFAVLATAWNTAAERWRVRYHRRGIDEGLGILQRRGACRGEADVTDALAKVGYRHVLLDPSARTVRFSRRGIELDPGGIGKGYAVDRIVDVLKRERVDVALVSAAGSSIYGLGAPPEDSRGWPITIRSPRDPKEEAATVFLRNMSLSTSGSYEKFFWAEGRTYSHIMDPRTGYPARGTSAVSVLAARTLDSEAWTKPFFINGRDWTSGAQAGSVSCVLLRRGAAGGLQLDIVWALT